MSSAMQVTPIETNVLFSEGLNTWHHKGSQPYLYLLPRGTDLEEFDPGKISPSQLQAPPLGMRSALALGGLGTGTMQLRTDGSLADWQIFNNSPGDGAPKVHVPSAFLGIRTKISGTLPKAFTVRTQAPDELPTIQTIAASGGFPATVLYLSDPDLLLATHIYAYGAMDLHDPMAAAIPAVLFSTVLSNPTPYPVTTSIMFAMPNLIEGTFRTENGLILSRSGDTPMSGELCMAFSPGSTSSSMVAPDLAEIWDTFSESGSFQRSNALGILEYGAISTQFVLEPGASRTASLILSWNFPNRYIAGEQVGNLYSKRFTTTRAVNQHIERRLPDLWQSMQDWQQLCLENSLPSSIQDALVNSLSLLYKTTFSTADGRWRHWDSFANPGISSLDQLMYRIFPLLFFAPDVLKNQLRAFATRQHANGRILIGLGMGERYPLDGQEGEFCTTQTPVFFLLTYLYYCYTNDRNFLQDLWPHIDKAINWHLSITNPEGLPSNFPQLGDWQAMESEGVTLTDALLHIGGLDAVIRIAKALKVSNEVDTLEEVVKSGTKALNTLFWNEDRYLEHSLNIRSEEPGSTLLGFLFPLLANIQIVPSSHIAQHLERFLTSDNERFPARIMEWTALQILVSDSPRKGLSRLSEHLAQQRDQSDLWGYYEQLTDDGLPWANPNHTSHLAIWFIPLALSGQQYEAPGRILRFMPRTSENSRLPFFTPEAHGMLTVQKGDQYTIEVISGRLILNELHIGPTISHRDVFLEKGQSLVLRG